MSEKMVFFLIWLIYLLGTVKSNCANTTSIIHNTTAARCGPQFESSETICGWLSSDNSTTANGTTTGGTLNNAYTCGCNDDSQNINLWPVAAGTSNETCPVVPTSANSPGSLYGTYCTLEFLQCNAPIYCGLPTGITDTNSTSCPSTGSLHLLGSLGIYKLVGAAISFVFGNTD